MANRSDKAANHPYWDPILQLCRRWVVPLSLVAIVLASLFVGWGIALADLLHGRVVGVSDGDTIIVLDADQKQFKIRLAAIDAPEKDQAFGIRSKKHLSDLVFGKPIDVVWTKHDRYGRIVGKVWVAPAADCPEANLSCPVTLDVGLAQINAGMAWHYKQYAKEQTPKDRQRYSFEEEEAQVRRAGLWADKNPTPPWEWRSLRRVQQ